MLEDFLFRNNLFYSDSLDLTTNIQKLFSRLEGKTPETKDNSKNTCI